MSEVEDMEQEERARKAKERPAGQPTPISEILQGLGDARAAWERRRLAVIESDCPPCRVDSAKAKVCAFRGHDFCAHKPELERRARTSILARNLLVGKVPQGPRDHEGLNYWDRILQGKFGTNSAVAAARRIVADEGRLAIFSGNAGAGKSLGMALALAERGGFFVSAAALDPFGKEANVLLDHCGEVPLLGLDDAGAGRSASDVARARLEQLACQRWDAGRPTIITTNCTQAEFWPLYGGHLGRLADRLSSDPIGWVQCLEESHRTAPESM